MTGAPADKGRRRRIVLAVAYAALVWAACSIPGDSLPMSILWSWDKFWHLLAFALLAVLWGRAGYGIAAIAIAGFAYGGAIEVWQQFAPIGRYFDPLDLLANAAGLTAGLVLLAAAERWK
jgi:VanZ family protein